MIALGKLHDKRKNEKKQEKALKAKLLMTKSALSGIAN